MLCVAWIRLSDSYQNVQDGNDYVVCVTNTDSTTELIDPVVSSLPQINLSASTTYNEFSNPQDN